MPSQIMDCPILWINAPKGTGKTTATKFLKRLIDPDAGGTISPVGTTRDFAASVSSRYIVGVDNVSRIGVKMSDVYCRAVTGDTLSRRKLFTDNYQIENTFLKLKRWRGIATRYAKTTSSYVAAVQICCMFLWLQIV